MKKWLIGFLVFVVFVAAGGAGAYWYVSPDQKLDLRYEPVPLEDRALSMLKKLSTEMILSASDINNLAKESIAQNPQYSDDVAITGADFSLNAEDRLVADVNVKIIDRVPVGLKLIYRLEWHAPNLIAVVEKASIKGVSLPASQFDDVVIPIGNDLPRLIQIKSVNVDNGALKIVFQKPSLKNLEELLR